MTSIAERPVTRLPAARRPPERLDCRRTPRWSARPCRDSDRDDVLAWFTEPDFFYRTAQPDTRPEWEVFDLVGDDSRMLLADDEPMGLYAFEAIGAAHNHHYQLHLRLHAAAPRSWWQSSFEEVVRGLRWQHDVVRLALLVGEFDRRGLEVVRSLGLTYEGTLAGVTVQDDQRHGYAFYSRIWAGS